jgi:hypothetical protein
MVQRINVNHALSSMEYSGFLLPIKTDSFKLALFTISLYLHLKLILEHAWIAHTMLVFYSCLRIQRTTGLLYIFKESEIRPKFKIALILILKLSIVEIFKYC